MKYFDELKKSMQFLSKNEKTVFIGQAVEVPGTAMSNTLQGINSKKLIELPVAEEMQMGITTGLALNGDIPISIYPRWNFLLLAMNQLINHLDKVNIMSNNGFGVKAIIRTGVGSQRPLHPQHQHIGDFTDAVKKMCTSIDIIKLNDAEDIFPSYEKALNRKDGKSTILVEFGDYYNEK
jgi:pyruvate/2-oxoglutarate/acetoin dehydrogenase E1 component